MDLSKQWASGILHKKVDLIKYMLFPLLAFEPLDTVHTKKRWLG